MAPRPATSIRTVASIGGSRLLNVPNTITAVRTCAAMALAVPAVAVASVPLAASAYLTYWVGDIADGMAARRLRQETRAGAVLDIVAVVVTVVKVVSLLAVSRLPAGRVDH